MVSENVIYFQKRVTSFTHSLGIKKIGNWKLEMENTVVIKKNQILN